MLNEFNAEYRRARYRRLASDACAIITALALGVALCLFLATLG